MAFLGGMSVDPLCILRDEKIKSEGCRETEYRVFRRASGDCKTATADTTETDADRSAEEHAGPVKCPEGHAKMLLQRTLRIMWCKKTGLGQRRGMSERMLLEPVLARSPGFVIAVHLQTAYSDPRFF